MVQSFRPNDAPSQTIIVLPLRVNPEIHHNVPVVPKNIPGNPINTKQTKIPTM